MDISLIVCTCGTHADLERLLASATALEVPDGLAWELLIVDNGAEGVRQLVDSFAGRLPIRIAAEPSPGLSHARNRGLAEAKGRYLCWTDDDVTLDPGWLSAWARAFRRHPGAAVFGGTILAVPEPPAARWFAKSLDDWPLQALTATRRPAAEVPILTDDLPWGANFALRADALGLLRFDPELGHGPSRRVGEESALTHRLLRSGAEGWWIPDSIVFHHIARERQTFAHLRDYFLRAGETAAFLHARSPGDNPNAVPGRWNPAAAPRPILRCLAAAAAPLALVIGIPGLERQGVRLLARRSLWQGILSHRRCVGRETGTSFRTAGQA